MIEQSGVHTSSGGVLWAEFERVSPEMAARGRELFDRWGFVFVGTVTADGTPRISPVEVHLVNGDLMLVMVTGSQKARDVRRDARITLQTPLTDPADPGAEFKARGRLEAANEDQRETTAMTVQSTSGWRPTESWSIFSVRIRAAAHLTWVDGDLVLLRWDSIRGLRPPSARSLDLQEATYRETRPDLGHDADQN